MEQLKFKEFSAQYGEGHGAEPQYLSFPLPVHNPVLHKQKEHAAVLSLLCT